MARLQNNYFNRPGIPIKKSDIPKITQALRAGGVASPKTIKKAAKTTPTLSKGMQKWVESNRSKLKNPTEKQDAIFKQYDKLQKEGRLHKDTGMPSNSNKTENKTESSNTTTSRKPDTNSSSPASDKAVPGGYTISPSDKAVEGGYTVSSISKAKYRALLSNAKNNEDIKRIKRKYRDRVR